MITTVNLVDVNLSYSNDKMEIMNAIDTLIKKRMGGMIFFVYFHCLVVSMKDSFYRKALNDADIILPDGIGVQLLARLSQNIRLPNLNGTDLIPALFNYLSKKDREYRIFLLGSGRTTIEKAHTGLKKTCPNLLISGFKDGSFAREKERAAIEKIIDSQTDLLLVGLGTPYQEKWAHRNQSYFKTNGIVCIGVGGLFDFMGGVVKRSPLIMRNLKMEWLYRLITDPRQHLRKNLSNLLFLKVLASELMRTRKSVGRG